MTLILPVSCRKVVKFSIYHITSYVLDISRSEIVGIFRDRTFHSDSDVTELVESNIRAGMKL